MAFLSTRSLQGDMHAICRGDGLFPRGKNVNLGKICFPIRFSLVIVEKKQHPSEERKCSQPAQTNPVVGLPFFTNSKV